MKLYILKPKEGLTKENNPWEPWYDKCFGMVVRARTEEDARRIADEHAGNENSDYELDFSVYPVKRLPKPQHVWLKENYSTCVELSSEGPEELIIQDEKHA